VQGPDGVYGRGETRDRGEEEVVEGKRLIGRFPWQGHGKTVTLGRHMYKKEVVRRDGENV
jgi:hypothetical protein